MRTVATLTATAVALFLGVAPARAFDDTLKTHGGFWNWRAFQTMRFDLEGWPFSKNRRGREYQTVDLLSRRVRIDGDAHFRLFHLGFDGKKAWVSPSKSAVSAPLRFYAQAPSQ